MTILTLSDAVLRRLTASDGRIVRDKVLCGLCIKLGRRTRTFLIATSVCGRQTRVTLGRWPLLTVKEARELALPILQSCRAGHMPHKSKHVKLPTLREALSAYAAAKKITPSSTERYSSLLRTHFAPWLNDSITDLGSTAFSEQCQKFASSKGNALVELGRGLIGALFNYLNAVYGLELLNPFARMAHAGLLPERAQPRPSNLLQADLRKWRLAVDRLPEKQRDFLLLTAYTGLRRGECAGLTRGQIDFEARLIKIPRTKNGKPHSLPITEQTRIILERRCAGLSPEQPLFCGVSRDHLAELAMRAGAPKFMLHDLRKLLATAGARLNIGDAVMRRILNHIAKKPDTLHRHYVSLNSDDIAIPLTSIQTYLNQAMGHCEPAGVPASRTELRCDSTYSK